MKSLNAAYAETYTLWIRTNPGLRINEYGTVKLISTVYSNMCHMEIVKKKFSRTGIFPMNQDVFLTIT
jgi:hypothetical protein